MRGWRGGQRPINATCSRREKPPPRCRAGCSGSNDPVWTPPPPPIPSTKSTSARSSTTISIRLQEPAAESVEKPSFENVSLRPLTLGDYLRSQLSVSVISGGIRDAADSIIGNWTGRLPFGSLEEIASAGEHTPEDVAEALKFVTTLDPAGVGARNLQECLLLQIESLNGKGGVAWQIVSHHIACWKPASSRKSPVCWAVHGAVEWPST